MGDELAHDRLEFGVDAAVFFDDLGREPRIEACKGVERLPDHDEDGFGDMPDAGRELGGALSGFADAAHALGHFFRLVANALKVGDDLDDAEDQAQIDGGGLSPGDQLGALVVDDDFQRVDILVAGNDFLDGRQIAGAVGFDGGRHLILDQAAHLQDVAAQATEIFVKLARLVMQNIFHQTLLSPCGR